jgi:hypothetical protein
MESAKYGGFVPGAVGPFIDDTPLITHAHIKPYVIAILLHRGAVRFHEIISSVAPHCAAIDLKVGAWDSIENCSVDDMTRLELLVGEVLGEMVGTKLLRYNEEQDLWVMSLGDNRQNLPTFINWVASLGGQLPAHLLTEMSFFEITGARSKCGY